MIRSTGVPGIPFVARDSAPEGSIIAGTAPTPKRLTDVAVDLRTPGGKVACCFPPAAGDWYRLILTLMYAHHTRGRRSPCIYPLPTEGFCQHLWAAFGAGKELSSGGVIAVVHETHWTGLSRPPLEREGGGSSDLSAAHLARLGRYFVYHRQSLTLFPREFCFPSRDGSLP